MISFLDEKAFKFGLVGIVNTIVGSLIMFGLYNVGGLKALDNNAIFQDAGYWLSSAANYTITSMLSYILNKHITFRNKERGAKPIIRFIINIALCYLLAYGLAKPTVLWLISNMDKSETLKKNIAMFFGMCLFVAFNYTGQRYFAFREKRTNKPSKTNET